MLLANWAGRKAGRNHGRQPRHLALLLKAGGPKHLAAGRGPGFGPARERTPYTAVNIRLFYSLLPCFSFFSDTSVSPCTYLHNHYQVIYNTSLGMANVTTCFCLRIENRPTKLRFFKMSKMVDATQHVVWGGGWGDVNVL